MKALKILLIAIIGILGLLLVIAAFLPSEYRVERSVVINAQPATVFEYVANFEHWDKWSPWQEQDPQADFSYSDPGRGAGAVLSWDGKVIGAGTLTFTDVQAPREIQSRVDFTAPYEMTSYDTWMFEPEEGGTKLTWTDEGTLGWPLERWFGLFIDQQLGPQFEHGLTTLKGIVESKPSEDLPPAPPSDHMEMDNAPPAPSTGEGTM
ncbi:SRPBCC family protein [bacterium]|nr:SRPBCC family protein [bacterium]